MSMKMFVVPVMMLGLNFSKIDVNSEENKLKIQIAFVTASVFTVLTYAVVTVLALFKGDTARMVKVSEKQLTGEKAGEEVMAEYTYRDYDLKQVRTKMTSILVAMAITSFIHYKWGTVHPLLIQSVLQPMNALSDPLAKIWLMGADDSKGSNKRPFAAEKPPSIFSSFAAAADPKKEEEKEKGQERKAKGAANKSTVKRRIKD